jgi:hypothetical protein
MALVEATSPTPITTQQVSTVTSGSFTPPSASVLFVFAGGGWSSSLPQTLVITDSLSHTWNQLALVQGTQSGVGGVVGIWWLSLPIGSAAMTVTATTNQANGMVLAPRVFTGANPNQSSAVVVTKNNSLGTTSGDTVGTVSITTTVSGSLVRGIAGTPNSSYTYTVNGNTTQIAQLSETFDSVTLNFWQATSTTGTPGAITLGGTWSHACSYNIAAVEVVPLIVSPIKCRVITQAVKRAAYI